MPAEDVTGSETLPDLRHARIWVSLEQRINLGSYESITAAGGASAVVVNSDRAIKQGQRRLLAATQDTLDHKVEALQQVYQNPESNFL